MTECTPILTDPHFKKLSFEDQFIFLEHRIRQQGKPLNIKIPFSTKKRRAIIFKEATPEKKRAAIRNIAVYLKVLEDMADPEIREQINREFQNYLENCRKREAGRSKKGYTFVNGPLPADL